MAETLSFKPQGVCSVKMNIVHENGIILDASVVGGCNGNLKGLKSLIKGMDIDDVIKRLQGITCKDKPTSCPDQLAQCLIQYKSRSKVEA